MVQLDDGHVSGSSFLLELTTTFRYDAAGNRIEHHSPYGVVTIAQFDDLNRVTSLSSRGEDGRGPSSGSCGRCFSNARSTG